jgi:hypothetical protein
MENFNGGSLTINPENDIPQNITPENVDAALDKIIQLMNLTEKQKVKRVEVIGTLEKKVIRQLQKGKNEKAIEELKNIIDEYKSLGLIERARLLDFTLNQFIRDIKHTSAPELEPSPQIKELNESNALQILEFRSKKAIRRVIQGKLQDAESEIVDIIHEFYDLGMDERAQALEGWLHNFQEQKSDIEELNKPLYELLRNDPALQEQLLSYRTQKVLKEFHQGDHKKAVLEFTEIVNDYKRQGKLDTVEMLEIWFNLFITKTFLVKPKIPPPSYQKPSPIKSSSTQVPLKQPLPPQQTPPQPNPTKPPIKLSASIAQNLSPKLDTPALPTEDPVKAKISKIKALLKEFEDKL